MVRRSLIMVAIALATAQVSSEGTGMGFGGARLGDGAPQNKPDASGVFVCGVDQSVAPIALHWTTLVLAGDGRFYTPCPGIPNRDPPHPADHRENRERLLLSQGRRAVDPDIRWRAAQVMARNVNIRSDVSITKASGSGQVTMEGLFVDDAVGKLFTRPPPSLFVPVCNVEAQYFGSVEDSRRWQPGPVFQFLIDDSVDVRKDAAYAIGSWLARPDLDPDLVSASTNELRACLRLQTDPVVQGLIFEALGVARYRTPAQREAAEAFLAQESQGPPLKILGAVKGLEAMIRQNPQPGLAETTRIRLRQIVTSYGNRAGEGPLSAADARIRLLALSALLAAGDTDLPTFRQATADEDWQMRRLVASRLNLMDPAHAQMAATLAVDPAFQVRHDLLASVSRLVANTHACGPIVERFKDPSPAVVMRAMDVLVPTCTDLDDAVKALAEWAEKLEKPEEVSRWHVPSRALTALTRVRPEAAGPHLAAAMKYPVWEVRAAAAAAIVDLADEGAAMALSSDVEPNVRTAALDALSRMNSPAVVPRAIEELKSGEDYQLLRTAALVLHNLPDAAKADATDALLGALRRLTAQETDTSRDPRVAIIERLAETLSPERSGDLLTYTIDYDDSIIAAARKAFEAIKGTPPAEQPKRRRYPYQPTLDQLSRLPSEARIQLEDGVVELQLLTDVAPVTVARFAELVAQGFYQDRTFHRAVPNFIVQGGSPGANDYSATSRFMRDEVGPQAAHVRGAVGMSSRGTDRGDGQFFIDLVDLPRFDRDYTVFAYVTKGMELVDALLDGSKIVSVSVK